MCDPQEIKVSIPATATLEDLIQRLMKDPAHQLEKPSIAKPGLSLYMQKPEALRQATTANLKKALSELVEDGDVLTVTDPVFPMGMRLDVLVRLTK